MPPNETIECAYLPIPIRFSIQNVLRRNETRYYRDESSFWFPVDIYTHVPSDFAVFFFPRFQRRLMFSFVRRVKGCSIRVKRRSRLRREASAASRCNIVIIILCYRPRVCIHDADVAAAATIVVAVVVHTRTHTRRESLRPCWILGVVPAVTPIFNL